MKKYTLSILLLGSFIGIFAQSHIDALRYSQHTIGGTARSVAMSGAFGALGGDFSTLSSNPAGLGVYRGSEFTFTPEFYYAKSTSRINNTTDPANVSIVEEGKFNFNISNLGYVGHFSKDNDVLKAINFGIGFNRIANFHKSTIINGDNPVSSYGDYMALHGYWGGLETENVSPDVYFSSDLFYRSGVTEYISEIDTFQLSGQYFTENGDFLYPEQRVISNETGKINEWTISLGFNVSDVLYFGATLGIQPLTYKQERYFKEYDANERSYQYFNYHETIKDQGTGYTGKIGLIFRPISLIRLGAAIHLPVTYNIKSVYSSKITTQNGTFLPNYYSELESNYTVVTPFKAVGSAAVVLGRFLIVSSDLDYIDYSSMRMSSKDYDLDEENENIDVIYKDAINFKLGTELRLGKTYLRGGFGYYGSPYAQTEENDDAFRLSYTGGFGFRSENFFFDIAYQYANSDERQILYEVSFGDNYDAPVANIDTKMHRVMTTIGFRF